MTEATTPETGVASGLMSESQAVAHVTSLMEPQGPPESESSEAEATTAEPEPPLAEPEPDESQAEDTEAEAQQADAEESSTSEDEAPDTAKDAGDEGLPATLEGLAEAAGLEFSELTEQMTVSIPTPDGDKEVSVHELIRGFHRESHASGQPKKQFDRGFYRRS